MLTPRINDWLMQHGDDARSEVTARWVYKQLKTQPRIRSGSFSASSSGDCLRYQELQYLGMPSMDTTDPRLQNIFDDGKWRHLRWQSMLMDAGLLTRCEMPLYWRNKRSRGTIDGYGIVPDDHPRTSWQGLDFGFELKGMNPYMYSKVVKGDQDIKEEHTRQFSRYFLMGGFDLFVVIYENKATQEWFEWVVEPDDQLIAESQQELDDLNQAIEHKHLHDMLPQCKIRTGAFKECPFGRTAQGTCPKAGTWPYLTTPTRRTS